jgi:hypothetical protein
VDRGVGVLLGWVASALLWLAAAAVSLLFLAGLALPERTCEALIPPFEGLTLEEAHRRWPPPLIRCTLVDYDAAQLGETSQTSTFDWDVFVLVLLLDTLALLEGGRRVRCRGKQRQSAHATTQADHV